MEWVDQVCEDLDWKTQFGPEEIVHSIVRILENNPDLIINEELQNKIILLQVQLNKCEEKNFSH